MEINCQFYYSENRYGCSINKANITEKEREIKKIEGVHQPEKGHKDVKYVWFNQNVNYFPRGLQKHFPNFTHLIIIGGGIKEISKNDLNGLEGLVSIYLEGCQLTSLPDDLFTEMPNLREVSLYGNKIEFASSEFLKPLLGRENVRVSLQGNKSIDDRYWPGYQDSLESLEVLMELIDEKCIKPAPSAEPVKSDPRIKEMWLSGSFSDLTIIADDKKFKVHKAILGMESKVFAKMFEDQGKAAVIDIPDFSADSVEALLKFIYTNETSEDGNAREIFEIANKFKVAAMKTIYEEIIGEQINEENVWETFLFAHRFSSQQLKEKAFKVIVKKIPEVLPDKLMEDPEELKKLIDARRVYEELLLKVYLS